MRELAYISHRMIAGIHPQAKIGWLRRLTGIQFSILGIGGGVSKTESTEIFKKLEDVERDIDKNEKVADLNSLKSDFREARFLKGNCRLQYGPVKIEWAKAELAFFFGQTERMTVGLGGSLENFRIDQPVVRSQMPYSDPGFLLRSLQEFSERGFGDVSHKSGQLTRTLELISRELKDMPAMDCRFLARAVEWADDSVIGSPLYVEHVWTTA